MTNQHVSQRRRPKYKTAIYKADYFVVQHLQNFLTFFIETRIRKGAIVADIGCGEQPLRSQLEANGAVYTGVDVNQNMQLNVDVIAPATLLPFSDNSFDIVICTEVLEHVSDTATAFKELARITKQGGDIVVTIPFIYPLHEEPYDFSRLTPYLIREYAQENRLSLIYLQTTGNEIEVLATVWDNMWYRRSPNHGLLGKLWNVAMRLSMNMLAKPISIFMGRWLPKKYFLNTVCILTKLEPVSSH
jgi:SAM-dependent methyltransferase